MSEWVRERFYLRFGHILGQDSVPAPLVVEFGEELCGEDCSERYDDVPF